MPSGWITRKSRLAIYDRDELVCCYCEKKCQLAKLPNMTRDEQKAHWKANQADIVTLDHIVSQWEIAKTCNSAYEFKQAIRNPKNLVAVCNACNASKRHVELYIWAVQKGFDYSKILERIADRTQKELINAQ